MFALVFAISVVWTLAFESPVIIIEKYIFGGGNRKRPVGAPNKSVNTTKNIISLVGSIHDKENINVENGLHHRST